MGKKINCQEPHGIWGSWPHGIVETVDRIRCTVSTVVADSGRPRRPPPGQQRPVGLHQVVGPQLRDRVGAELRQHVATREAPVVARSGGREARLDRVELPHQALPTVTFDGWSSASSPDRTLEIVCEPAVAGIVGGDEDRVLVGFDHLVGLGPLRDGRLRVVDMRTHGPIGPDELRRRHPVRVEASAAPVDEDDSDPRFDVPLPPGGSLLVAQTRGGGDRACVPIRERVRAERRSAP